MASRYPRPEPYGYASRGYVRFDLADTDQPVLNLPCLERGFRETLQQGVRAGHVKVVGAIVMVRESPDVGGGGQKAIALKNC